MYPIKVNQESRVVEEVVRFGRPYHHGLEAGSKPELLAVLAMLDDEDALIICNGYKDEEYVETALLGSKIGRTIIMVVEKPSELQLIARIAQKTGVRPVVCVQSSRRGWDAGKPREAIIRSLVCQHVSWWRQWRFYASTVCWSRSNSCTFTWGARFPTFGTLKRACGKLGALL